MRRQRTCTEDGCDGPHSARGLCKKHYGRWSRQQPHIKQRHMAYEARRRRNPKRQEQERQRNRGRNEYQRGWAEARKDWGAWWERRRYWEDKRDLRAWRPKVWPHCKVSHRPKARYFIGRICVACGSQWVSYIAMPDTDYCSPCNEKRWKADGRHKRRAWKAAAVVRDVISPEEVFSRDGYRCQLCGDKTHGTVPSSSAPTVDHIVPLAVGGDHSYANVQCACFSCNCRKGAGAANDQLRLNLAA